VTVSQFAAELSFILHWVGSALCVVPPTLRRPVADRNLVCQQRCSFCVRFIVILCRTAIAGLAVRATLLLQGELQSDCNVLFWPIFYPYGAIKIRLLLLLLLFVILARALKF